MVSTNTAAWNACSFELRKQQHQRQAQGALWSPPRRRPARLTRAIARCPHTCHGQRPGEAGVDVHVTGVVLGAQRARYAVPAVLVPARVRGACRGGGGGGTSRDVSRGPCMQQATGCDGAPRKH